MRQRSSLLSICHTLTGKNTKKNHGIRAYVTQLHIIPDKTEHISES